MKTDAKLTLHHIKKVFINLPRRERGGSVVECRTPEREVGGSKHTAAVLCPWARHFTPRKYWFITQEAVAPSRHDWKIVDWDVKPQHKQKPYQGKIYNLDGYIFYKFFTIEKIWDGLQVFLQETIYQVRTEMRQSLGSLNSMSGLSSPIYHTRVDGLILASYSLLDENINLD